MAKETTKEEAKDIQHSEAYLQYEKIVEAYKKSNPTKFEMKKAAFQAKLASL